MEEKPDEDARREAAIQRALATAPPLTPEQIRFLRGVLHDR